MLFAKCQVLVGIMESTPVEVVETFSDDRKFYIKPTTVAMLKANIFKNVKCAVTMLASTLE